MTDTVVERAQAEHVAGLAGWIERHDDSWLFIGLYVTLAIVLSIVVSLFWLVALVAVHFGLECYKHSRMVTRNRLLLATESLWAVLLDIGLVLFALALSLYMDVVFGVLGLSVAARAGAHAAGRVGSRLAGWQNVLRGILLTVDDAVHVGKTVVLRKGDAIVENEAATVVSNSWSGPWSRGEHVTFWFTVTWLLLIIASPWLLSISVVEVIQMLQTELRPLP